MVKQKSKAYFQQASDDQPTDTVKRPESVSWTISDGPNRQFTAGWYILTTLLFGVLIVAAAWPLQSVLTAVLFGLIYVALIIYTRRTPQDVTYRLDDDGLFINDQLYTFDKFSGFGIVEDGKRYTIIMLPSQRLATALTLNFDRINGEKIVDFLGAILPMRQINENIIDRLVRRLGL